MTFTFTVVTGLLGENLEEGPTLDEFFDERMGRGLLPKLTFGRDPNPLYFGLKLAAPGGGRSGEDLLRFLSVSSPSWMRAESRDENPGDRTSTRR